MQKPMKIARIKRTRPLITPGFFEYHRGGTLRVGESDTLMINDPPRTYK